ncbi:hypothetical protein C0J52_01882 [Blattella germanica]|nr:hypothetical protein C0J52_01882 [Blattella germanica]
MGVIKMRVIPAGILQFPFYGRGLESLNYGSIGSILGHELTHGFDIEGKNYGKDGKRVSWWNTDMLKAYEDRAQCFIEQYDSFGSENYKVNGKQTLAENIADNGGIREAFKAYQKYKERHDPEPYLPGLESFTHEQLLFLAFANIWCLDEGPDYESVAVKDSHSPGRYRVLGSLSNSPEFTETWILRWAGHIIKMEENNPARKLTLLKPEGSRRVGRPKLRWMDGIEEDLRTIGTRACRRRALTGTTGGSSLIWIARLYCHVDMNVQIPRKPHIWNMNVRNVGKNVKSSVQGIINVRNFVGKTVDHVNIQYQQICFASMKHYYLVMLLTDTSAKNFVIRNVWPPRSPDSIGLQGLRHTPPDNGRSEEQLYTGDSSY